MSDELQALILKAKAVQMTAEEREAQRISFAYGNVRLDNENVTRETVERASARLRSVPDDSTQHAGN